MSNTRQNVGLLLSGGIDSICLAYLIKPKVAFTLNYGQNAAEAEIQAASFICGELAIQHEVICVDCSVLGSGDLSSKEELAIAPKSDWWPFRNQLLVTLCASRAVTLGLESLITGSVKSDGYHKDGTGEFYQRLNDVMSYQEGGLKIEAPGLAWTTEELIELSKIPKSLLYAAHSCHKANIPCGNCRGCNKYESIMAGVKNA